MLKNLKLLIIISLNLLTIYFQVMKFFVEPAEELTNLVKAPALHLKLLTYNGFKQLIKLDKRLLSSH